jgi:putative spermidine/putrescine transport system substrate-binding protein
MPTCNRRPITLPEGLAEKFLPASDYERAVAVDYDELDKAQASFGDRYLNEVR